MSQIVNYDGSYWKRIWFDPMHLDEITTYCQSFMKNPADTSDNLDIAETDTFVGYSQWDGYQSWWQGNSQAFGVRNADGTMSSMFRRVDSENTRVCAWLTNFEESHEDSDNSKPVKKYLDFQCDIDGNIITTNMEGYSTPVVLLGYSRGGLSIENTGNLGETPASNLTVSSPVRFEGSGNNEDPLRALVEAQKHTTGEYNPVWRLLWNFPAKYVAASSLMVYSKLPIFDNALAAKAYIEDGTIDPETCYNCKEVYDNKENEYYIQSRAYLYNNKNEQPYAKDSDPNKLRIKVKGRVHGYVQHNRGKYNVALVVEPNEGISNMKYSAGHYSTDSYTTDSISNFLSSIYADDWNTWKEFEPYSVDKWVRGMDFKTNIYIYATRTAAEDAFEDPSIIPINYDDVDDSPENTTGDPVETADDLTSHTNETISGMLTLWRLNAAGMTTFGNALSDYPNWSDKETALKIYGESPINALVSVYHSCIDLDDFISKLYTNGLQFGSHFVEIGTGAVAKITEYGKMVTVGSCLFNPIYGDYRDYTNFTYELHLPFSNPITFDTREVMGKSMVIKATVDPYAMQMRYYIILNGAVYRAVDVAFGTQIGVVGNDAAGKAREMRQDMISVKESKMAVAKGILTGAGSVAVGMATGGPLGAITAGATAGANVGLASEVSKMTQMNQLQDAQLDPTRTFVGSFSPGCAESDILYPYLVTYETRAIVPAALESTYGRPANIIGKLGSVSGYTCAELARVAVNCTEAEKAEIEQLVNGGIII